MNHHIHLRGFTLIELLVVISIIGILSLVVLASVRIARDKGEVTAGLKFGGYNFRTFNMYKESLTATEVFNIYAQGVIERAMAHK